MDFNDFNDFIRERINHKDFVGGTDEFRVLAMKNTASDYEEMRGVKIEDSDRKYINERVNLYYEQFKESQGKSGEITDVKGYSEELALAQVPQITESLTREDLRNFQGIRIDDWFEREEKLTEAAKITSELYKEARANEPNNNLKGSLIGAALVIVIFLVYRSNQQIQRILNRLKLWFIERTNHEDTNAVFYYRVKDQIHGPYLMSEIKHRYAKGMIHTDQLISENTKNSVSLNDHLTKITSQAEPLPESPVELTKNVPLEALDANSDSEIQVKPTIGIGRIAYAITIAFVVAISSILASAGVGPIFINIISIFILLIASYLRLLNIGSNPNRCYFLLIPILGLIITIPCLLLPENYEKYRKIDLGAKIISIAMIIILCVLMYSLVGIIMENIS